MDQQAAQSEDAPTTGLVRVAVVDDHAVVVRGLVAELRAESTGTEVTATARSVDELLALQVPVDVVVLDLQLRDGSRPADNVARLLAHGARVLLFSAYEDDQQLFDAVGAGAHGYLSKARETSDVLEAIREIASGGEAVSAELLIALSAAARGRPDLSARQEDVLVRYTGSDAKLPTIARQLGMQPETLKTHLRRIKDKYASAGRPASTRLELYRRAVEDGYHGDASAGPGSVA